MVLRMNKQIVNIVNFIRGCEPRCSVDLAEPVREQLSLVRNYHFPATFLFQYDALIQPKFTDLFLNGEDSEQIETGVWLEIVQPQAEAAGISWRGRFPWDWHANVGFSVGYTPKERERLIDTLFSKYREIFGHYPKTVGSWIIDAHSLAYLEEKYQIDASCNCKDQWGTDGYTLWGAYYNQAYYPSFKNAFCPAQSREEQISVPVFRMLGSDPLDQYDFGMSPDAGAPSVQGVITLEPVYTAACGGGGNPDWVDWYLKENFNGKCLSFAYTQVGQENSFGWPAMREGLLDQFAKLDKLQKEGVIQIETLGESGRAFKQAYALTPASSICAESGFSGGGKSADRSSIWYNCRNYRINLVREGEFFRIRDFYLFRQAYPERYLTTTCTTDYLQYDNLPIMDGNRFSSGGVLAGIYPMKQGKRLKCTDFSCHEISSESLQVCFQTAECGEMNLIFQPEEILISATEGQDWYFSLVWDQASACLPSFQPTSSQLKMSWRGFAYEISACVRPVGKTLAFCPQNGKIRIGVVESRDFEKEEKESGRKESKDLK
jgi:hypothetical protein